MTKIKGWNLPTKELLDFDPKEKKLEIYFYENDKFDKAILFYSIGESPNMFIGHLPAG